MQLYDTDAKCAARNSGEEIPRNAVSYSYNFLVREANIPIGICERVKYMAGKHTTERRGPLGCYECRRGTLSMHESYRPDLGPDSLLRISLVGTDRYYISGSS